MNTKFDPDDSQLATLGSLDPHAPVAALNLFQYAAAIMYFPSRRAFIEMTMDPDFQAASRHRKAGLANHYPAHLDGAPWVTE